MVRLAAGGVVLVTGAAVMALLLGGCGGSGTAEAIRTAAPDRQGGIWTPPATGPGSAEYRHASVQVYKSGNTATDYWLYTPSSPVPGKAPVVIFNHGWSAIDPSNYAPWLTHLVRKGNIVIYPRWQARPFDAAGAETLPNAATAVKRALKRLERQGPVRPNRSQVAAFGHSVGGILAADLAATAADWPLPQPRVVFSVEPGGGSGGWGVGVTVADFSRIPADVLLLALAGADDAVVGDAMARRIFRESTAVAAANKNLVTVQSDNHGRPPLVADHSIPTGALDALDYYGLWKLGDALLDAAFRGTNREYALGNTARQRFMGRWPDRVRVKALVVE